MKEGTFELPGNCRLTSDYDVLQWDVREGCEVRQILDRIADKWSLLVIALLDKRTMRFAELLRSIKGVSKRMLTTTLRQLERDGIVERTVYPTVPPKVEYNLTPLGNSLHETVKALVIWTEANQVKIAEARDRYETRQSEGL
ncbi:transcriptional regulator [Pleomorphomonas diazotrophica]|uniref:Transcriptional regulator n=1 Tax=Pleomorphomonas diazotrophica TaxID=1166257 RepID=A0A1I4Q5A5_9HYPH|nr:helix-turn-helix domain-containing protein [Pleomorphomonas diazotrophica]PKR90951.1 transcriptional regulator [Pleomorphomonas diazotrophica]SFM34830.1 DNA-binding transcriptional regulator, HxlR family [Pleomorphomonas diazotrophica]